MCRAGDQFESKGCQAEEFSLTRGRVSLLFYTGFQLIGQGLLPTLWGAICLTQCTNLSPKLIQKCPHRNTQNNVWLSIWAPHIHQVDTNQPSHNLYSHFFTITPDETQSFFVPRASQNAQALYIHLTQLIFSAVGTSGVSSNSPDQDENLVLEPSFELQWQYSFHNHILVYFTYN